MGLSIFFGYQLVKSLQVSYPVSIGIEQTKYWGVWLKYLWEIHGIVTSYNYN
jgi:hypothetical protein